MAIQSITTEQRQSNFEVLRIIAMFLVMMVHANFMSIDSPTSQEISDNFLPSAMRIMLEDLSLLGVNIFVMISGWFSIKTSIKGLSGLLFQVYYFGIGILLTLTLMGVEQLTIGRVYQIVLLHKSGWFVISYIILYLLSPALNKFSEYAPKKEFRTLLISYFVLLMIFGWIDWTAEIGNGFSAVSMIGMYLLARYSRKYINFNHGGMLFFVCLLLNTTLSVAKIRYNLPFIIKSYDNPLIILGAWGLIMYFSHMNIKTSKIINYIARSTFAVYLFHIYPDVLDWFCTICKELYLENTGILCLMKMGLFLLCIYAFSIIIDAPRRLIWNGVWRLIGKYIK